MYISEYVSKDISIYIYINIYIYDLHGPRHIQKTGLKLIAIEPKLIAIPSMLCNMIVMFAICNI
jgi:hypothetical protein